ncbi:WD40 repeat-containing protein [Cavenderia fasciculata]|uniref:WD40 repeat-containing protein n=1 Tax=Cavenderia fasciculata TaxID=261658 RepID=F4PYE3_CACFS|nr:WD40 repeat-containing protein [Cavenderia fasciculata]EGG19410.1 WD40 repeat-containing protein [Cavenderia fasciculata]|eukprot:XP_004357681.1 WD40 repeat-containing protein [Cavenderia fasciculata]
MEHIPQEFIQIIRALASGDTETIKKAEERFNAFKEQPNQLIPCLLFLTLKEYASVLIRPLVSPDHKKSLWEKLSGDTKNTLKIELLNAVQVEQSASIRHKIVDIIASMAPELIIKGQWGDLIPFLINAATCANEALRETSYLIIGQIVPFLGPQIASSIELFKQLMDKGLNDQSLMVRIASLKAIIQFLSIPEIDSAIFQPLLPTMLRTITAAVEAHQEKGAQEAIYIFIAICEIKPQWFRNHIPLVIETFFKILVDETAEDDTRHYVFEFFMVLAEKRASAWKKNLGHLNGLVELMYKWLSEVDEIDINTWNSKETDRNEAEENTNADVAQEGFDRLANCLGKALAPIIIEFIPKLIKSPHWNHKYAALLSLTMIGEGLKDQLSKHLGPLLNEILVTVNDPNPRVRWALFFCLGQMSTDYGDDLRVHHKQLFAALGHIIRDPNPRVQGVACLFITSFLEESEKTMVEPVTSDLFTALLPLLNSPHYFVAENALCAFSSVVEVIGDQFKPYYQQFVPFILQKLDSSTTKETRALRGRAMEALSLIGLAVGKEMFAGDLKLFMEYMSKRPAFESDDPQIDFFLRACTRFCQCLGKEFAQYLNFTMQPLINAVKAKVEIITDEDEFEHQISEVGVMAMDNKALALSLLTFYADILQDMMFSYLPELIEPVLKLLDYEFNEEIRANAAALVPNLLSICIAKTTITSSDTATLFQMLLKRLLESTNTETNSEIISTKLRHVSDLIIAMGEKTLNQDQIKSIVTAYIVVIENLDELKEDLQNDVDEEDDDPQNGGEIDYILDAYSSATGMIGDLIRMNKENTIPTIATDILSNVLNKINDNSEEKSVQASMLCLLDDFCEFGGKQAINLYTHVIPPMISSLGSNDATVRHAASYGLGIASQTALQQFEPFLIQSLQGLNKLISSPNSKNEDNITATENAISAIGRFVRYQPQLSGHANQIVPLWLSQLPITDETESASCTENLIEILKMYPEQTFGVTFERVPAVYNIFEQSLPHLTEETKVKLSETYQLIKSALQGKWASLPATSQNAIQQGCPKFIHIYRRIAKIDYNTHYGFKSSTSSSSTTNNNSNNNNSSVNRQDFSATIKKLSDSLKKYYLVSAVNSGKLDKVREFFDIYSSELIKDPEWKHWFALPYLKTPHFDPAFEVYFSKGWSEAFSLSLRNFLSTIFKNIPLPKILQFNLERQNRKRLESQVESLINQNEELRSLVDKLEYQSRRDLVKEKGSSSEEKADHSQFSRGRRTESSNTAKLDQSLSPTMQQKLQSSTVSNDEDDKVVIGSVRSRRSVQALSNPTSSFEMTEMDDLGKRNQKISLNPSLISANTGGGESSYTIESQEACTSHTTAITRCKFSSNGSKIASSSVDGTVRISNVDGFTRHTTIYCLSEVISLEWENKTKLLLCGTTDSKIKLWNSTTDKAVGDINTSADYPRVEDIVCNPNGNSFASSSTNNSRTDGVVNTWNFRTLKIEDRLSSSNAIINSMSFNNNGTLLATGCVDGTVRIFDIKSGSPIGGWQAHSNEIISVQFFSDHKLFTIGKDSKLSQWNIHTMGKPEKEYEYPGFPTDIHRTTKIAFNPEGTSFAVGSNSKYALIYNIDNSNPVGQISGHSGPVVAVDWHPNSNWLVTGSLDHDVKLTKLKHTTNPI